MTLLIDPTSLGPRTLPSDALQIAASEWTVLNSELDQTALPVSMVPDEKAKGVLCAAGHVRMRHVAKGATYPTGLLAPKGFTGTPASGGDPITSQGRGAYVDFALNGANFNYTTRYLTLCRMWGAGGGIGGTIAEYGTWFEFQVTSGLVAANEYWQIVRQADPVDTLAIMAAALDADSSTWVEGTHWRAPNVALANYTGPSYSPGALPNVTPHPYCSGEIVDVDSLRISFRFDGPVSDFTRLRQNCTGGGTPSPDATGTDYKQVVQGRFPTEGPDGTSGHLEFFGDSAIVPSLNRTFAVNEETGGTGTWHWWVTFKSLLVGGALQLEALCDNAGRGDTSFDAMCHAEDYFRGISATWRGGVPFYAAPAAPGPGFSYYGMTDWDLIVTGCSSIGAYVEGYIRWNKNSERSNNCFFTQDCWTVTVPQAAIPASGAWVQLEGGSDPIGLIDGILSTPGKGEYRVAPAWFREADNARSAMGEHQTLDHPGGGIILDAGFPTAEDPDVDFLRIFRTLLDQPGDYFKVDDVPVSESTYEDDKGDGEIAGVIGSLRYNSREYRSRQAGYPPHFRHLVRHLGSAWGAGLSRWHDQTGTATFVKGSDVIDVDSPMVPSRRWEGRYVKRAGETERYRVLRVDVSAGEVTISKEYEGESGTSQVIELVDDRRSTKVGRAEPGFINQWPTVREWHGIDTVDELGVTALASTQRELFLWTRDGTWVLSGNSPTTFNLDPVFDGIGCCCHRSMIMLNGIAYWLEGPDGFFRWGFQGVPQRLSDPPFADSSEPYGIQRTVERINWEAIDWAWAIKDPDGRQIRWFVPVDGSEYPNLQIVWDIKAQTWRTETCDGYTAGCHYTRKDGTVGILVGDIRGHVHQLDLGDSDAVYEVEPRHDVGVSSTPGTIELAGTTLPAADLGSVPVLVLFADGTTERAMAYQTTTSSIDLEDDLERTPDIGDVVILGAIDLDVMPNRFHQGAPESRKSCPILWIDAGDGEGEYYLDVGVDDDGLEPPVYDENVGGPGVERFRINQIGYQHGFRIRSFMPGTTLRFRRFELQTTFLAVQKVER